TRRSEDGHSGGRASSQRSRDRQEGGRAARGVLVERSSGGTIRRRTGAKTARTTGLARDEEAQTRGDTAARPVTVRSVPHASTPPPRIPDYVSRILAVCLSQVNCAWQDAQRDAERGG